MLLEVQDTDSPRSSFIIKNSFSYPGYHAVFMVIQPEFLLFLREFFAILGVFVIPNEFDNCSF